MNNNIRLTAGIPVILILGIILYAATYLFFLAQHNESKSLIGMYVVSIACYLTAFAIFVSKYNSNKSDLEDVEKEINDINEQIIKKTAQITTPPSVQNSPKPTPDGTNTVSPKVVQNGIDLTTVSPKVQQLTNELKELNLNLIIKTNMRDKYSGEAYNGLLLVGIFFIMALIIILIIVGGHDFIANFGAKKTVTPNMNDIITTTTLSTESYNPRKNPRKNL